MIAAPIHDNAPTVLIVGAGSTGLTLACELARSGIPIRLIEATPGPQPGSRGKSLQPRSLEVFDDVGIVDRVLANGRMPMPIRTIVLDGAVTIKGTDTLGGRPDVPYPTTLLTPHWRVQEALRLRLAEFGGAGSIRSSKGFLNRQQTSPPSSSKAVRPRGSLRAGLSAAMVVIAASASKPASSSPAKHVIAAHDRRRHGGRWP